MIEIYDFWNAMWHEAWAPWDGLWLFQFSQRPIDRALGNEFTPREGTVSPQGRRLGVALRTA